jgi:hypothetical protein
MFATDSMLTHIMEIQMHTICISEGAVVVVIAWDLQLRMQSVPITTKIGNSKSFLARCTRYIFLCDKVCLLLAAGRCFFSQVLLFPPPIILTATI